MSRLQKLPQHIFSRIVGWLADRRWGLITQTAIRLFIYFYGVNMKETKNSDIRSYQSFNDFFTRHLNSSLRPIASDPKAIVSPADGVISAIKKLSGEIILQVKKHNFTITELLGGNSEQVKLFQESAYFSVYLAPKDYHRIHMPIDGSLSKMTYIPGHLFSVNPRLVRRIPQLFSQNERVVCLFKTQIGYMAIVIVGSSLVGSIHTVWHGTVAPSIKKIISVWNYQEKNINLIRGDELGHFKMGSTVILLFPLCKVRWESYQKINNRIFFGERIGTLIN
ncbi:phosphatidylserine decarboxylase [Coxiella endosymbiont of Amblyomma sculptum]|uniref:archaetidylserine decarboxylase n=1 Tax=Coxiella endosymbiont of Amblyomma sculptum TaxID=2487929 RepID=UPI00132E77B6|nr:archaetidylserine decarboxylase [Coxiella endosymbiont of Amblyomma sculptum]QHG92238.1 phosphatidylserine decarboxylase [Coxiella endosymbiont of Amblyomma sculptum]